MTDLNVVREAIHDGARPSIEEARALERHAALLEQQLRVLKVSIPDKQDVRLVTDTLAQMSTLMSEDCALSEEERAALERLQAWVGEYSKVDESGATELATAVEEINRHRSQGTIDARTANRVTGLLREFFSAAAESWTNPHIWAGDEEVSLEWWSRSGRKLSCYIKRDSVEFLKSWGPNIHTDMEDGEFPSDIKAKAAELWNWLMT